MLITILNVSVIALIAFLLQRKQPVELKPWFFPALFIKLLAGIGLGLVYKYYYAHGDTFDLFVVARAHTETFYRNPGEWLSFIFKNEEAELMGYLRALFFVKIISAFNIITYNNYWVTGMWFSFIVFVTSWRMFSTIVRYFSGSEYAAAAAFLFFPSVVFWSAGVVKESLALAGLCFLATLTLKLFVRERVNTIEWIVAAIMLWLTWNLKYYWIALFVPFALLSVVFELTAQLPRKKKFFLLVAVVFGLIIFVQFVHPNLRPGYFLKILVINHDGFIPRTSPENLIHYSSLEPTWTSVLVNAPWALWSGLFRPLPFQGHGTLAWIPSLENFAVLVFVMASFARKKIPGSRFRVLTWCVVTYSICLCIFLALSTPNLGSLARYKTGFMPFLMFVILYRNILFDRIVIYLSKVAGR